MNKNSKVSPLNDEILPTLERFYKSLKNYNEEMIEKDDVGTKKWIEDALNDLKHAVKCRKEYLDRFMEF